MALFVVSYDLIAQRNYKPLWDALTAQGAHRATESLWLLKVNNTCMQVLEWLQQFVDSDDRLFVAEIAGQNVVISNAKTGAQQWLNSNR